VTRSASAGSRRCSFERNGSTIFRVGQRFGVQPVPSGHLISVASGSGPATVTDDVSHSRRRSGEKKPTDPVDRPGQIRNNRGIQFQTGGETKQSFVVCTVKTDAADVLTRSVRPIRFGCDRFQTVRVENTTLSFTAAEWLLSSSRVFSAGNGVVFNRTFRFRYQSLVARKQNIHSTFAQRTIIPFSKRNFIGAGLEEQRRVFLSPGARVRAVRPRRFS